eukprot:m.114110 g.114110  ORF g.114110 m.114110 type:complete len:569 (-) comp16278_c0_seq2:25-1731(-)
MAVVRMAVRVPSLLLVAVVVFTVETSTVFGVGRVDAVVFYPGLESWHLTGSRTGPHSLAWAAGVDDKASAFLTYGPYVSPPPAPGLYKVEFSLMVDNATADNVEVLKLDVHDAGVDLVLTELVVTRRMFTNANTLQNFTLWFSLPTTTSSLAPRVARGATTAAAVVAAQPSSLEFRVFYSCCALVTHAQTTLLGPGDVPTMPSFWNNQSHFAFVSQQRFPTAPGQEFGANVGFHFVTRPEAWYLFHREYAFSPQPSYCKFDYARLVVLTSTNRGLSWSNKTVIATPVPNTSTECALVDGAGFFDEDAGVWHYLSQCLDRNHVWNLCHFQRAGPDPLGPFVPNPHNPVVRSGQLWSRICNGTGKHCTPGTGEEGTPEIVAKINGWFYITFHGWDPTAVTSARGVAKTRDFVSWTVEDGGATLPGDAIFSHTDCDPWDVPGGWANGRCVGGGEGTMLYSPHDNYFYHLIEAPDLSLGCLTTPGKQNWVLGLLRSKSLAAPSGQWQQFAVEATVIPAVKQGCYIQYHRLFADVADGQVYLEFWADNWMQLFRLVPGGAALPIIAGPPPENQ